MRQRLVIDSVACVLVAAGMTGCGGNNRMQPPLDAGGDAMQSPPDAGGDGPPDAGGDILVRGMSVGHFVTDTGTVDRPFDLSTSPGISVLVPTASGFDTRAGTGGPDGSFMVDLGAAAPPWQLALTYGAGGASPFSQFFVGDATRFNLDSISLGRPDQAFASIPTHVTLNVDGLSPWGQFDVLDIVSSNAGAIAHEVQLGFPAPPTPGVTAISGVTVPWFNRLIDTTKGDTAVIYQLVTDPASGPLFSHTLERIGQASPFTMVDGGTATMTATLSSVPLDRMLTVHVRRSLFEPFLSQVGPGAVPPLSGLRNVVIEALPGVAQHGFFDGDGPQLVLWFLDDGTADLDAAFTYGDPFKTAGVPWDDLVRVRYPFSVPVMASGAQVATSVNVGFEMFIPVAAFPADGVIAPVISPVRSVQIGGMDLMAPRTGVGLTPTVTWDAPAMGTPTGYFVMVNEVTTDANHKTVVNDVAEFFLTSTTLHIPPSVLASGHSYLLVISADLLPGSSYVAAPFLETGVAAHHHAKLATAQFTP